MRALFDQASAVAALLREELELLSLLGAHCLHHRPFVRLPGSWLAVLRAPPSRPPAVSAADIAPRLHGSAGSAPCGSSPPPSGSSRAAGTPACRRGAQEGELQRLVHHASHAHLLCDFVGARVLARSAQCANGLGVHGMRLARKPGSGLTFPKRVVHGDSDARRRRGYRRGGLAVA